MASYISESVNRNPLQWCFFTFPQCGTVTKSDFRNSLDPLGPYDFECYVQETHEDGNFHLHALVKFTTKITKSKILAHMKKTYPDDYKRHDFGRIKKNSSPWHAYQYLLKEDPSPLHYGTAPERNDPNRTRFAKLARDLGFESIEALSQHVEERRRRINEIDGKLLQCLANIEAYRCHYPLSLTWQHSEILRKFSKNFTLEFSGIDPNDENDKLHITSFIKSYFYPVINL